MLFCSVLSLFIGDGQAEMILGNADALIGKQEISNDFTWAKDRNACMISVESSSVKLMSSLYLFRNFNISTFNVIGAS